MTKEAKATAIKNKLDSVYQAKLISGTNIKTVNNQSLLGDGNLNIDTAVNTFSDLYDLITNAVDNDIISLNGNYKYDSETDSSLTAGIVIDKNITINGNGYIIDGDNSSRLFNISSSKTLKLNNINIINCSAPNNTNGGGAILGTSCTITLNKCYLYNNQAGYRTSNGQNGGAIFITSSTLNIYKSIFSKNYGYYQGGAIHSSDSTITINNSLLIENNAGDRGGAIYSTSVLNIYDSTISENATNHTGSYCNGGGIFVTGTTNIINSKIANNTAKQHYLKSAAQGAGIYASSTANLTIRNSTISNNNITGSNGNACGGAIYSAITDNTFDIENCVITNNTSPCQYKGIYSTASKDIYNCKLSDVCYNITNKLYLSGHQDISGKADLTGWTANKNLVTDSSGALTTEDKPTIPSNTSDLTNDSGFITINDVSNVSTSPGTFADLQTLITNASSGDTIVLDKDYKYDSTTDSSLSSGIEITKNITIIGNGHIIDGNNYARAFIDNNGYTWELNDLRIQNCTSYNDNLYGFIDGGAIYNYAGDLIINNCTFTQNNANNGEGGAIYNDGTLTINNTTFTNNDADGSGAIHNNNITTINNTQLINNRAINIGGAIGNYDRLNIKETIVKNNQADIYANIYSDYSIIIYNCEINDISTTCNSNVINKDYLTDHQSISGKLDVAQGSGNSGKFMKVDNSGNVVPESVTIPSAVTITNNLTTTSTGTALDASQGKALADMIGAAITYINQ